MMFGRKKTPELTERLIYERNRGGGAGVPEQPRTRGGWLPIGVISAAAAIGLSHPHDTQPAPTEPVTPVSQEAITVAPPVVDTYKPPTVEPGHLAAGDYLYQETATHEAGHVAALHDFGIPVWEVSADELGSGETKYPDHYFHDPQRDAYNYAVIDAAGEESAVVWLEQHGYTHDRAVVEAEPHAKSDLTQLEVDAERAGISERQAHDRAREIVLSHQPDIDRTAQRLIDRGGYLDEYELEH